MSEILKNIETCRGEDVLAEVSGLPQDQHFGSLVNEALDPLKQQALHQAGYDGYSEVIEQHKPYTFASFIRQMKSNLLLLLRALWQFPFGAGTLRSLADMWQHYITRLSGNETYGIPSRLSSLTDLPSAPLLLADRKISGADVPDGMSVVRILNDPSSITELSDETYRWEFKHGNGSWDLTGSLSLSAFTSLKKLTMNCVGLLAYGAIRDSSTLEELNIEGVTAFRRIAYQYPPIWNLTALKVLNAPSVTVCIDESNDYPCVHNCDNLEKIVLGKLDTFYDFIRTTEPNLIHFEIGQDTAISLNFAFWNPTNVLADNTKKAQFLSNFRTYIALRLATFASNGQTLTLSQAVYDAIKDESHLFVFDEGTMTIYAYLTNIKHWTVTK